MVPVIKGYVLLSFHYPPFPVKERQKNLASGPRPWVEDSSQRNGQLNPIFHSLYGFPIFSLDNRFLLKNARHYRNGTQAKKFCKNNVELGVYVVEMNSIT
jgi:hypothetical protein